MTYVLKKYLVSRYGVISGIVLCMLLCTGILSAQTTPQFSTPQNLSGSNSFPLNSSTNKIQLQYEAGEFQGSYSGMITRVYLQRSSTGSQATFTNLTISLGQSATWPSSTTTYFTPMTQVYYAATTIIPAGSINDWVGITLNTPFMYNPTQHLIAIICQEGYTNGISLRNVSVNPAPRRMWSSGGCATAAPTGNGNQRYNFGFDLIAAGPMTYTSSTTTQNTTTPVGAGTQDNEIIGVQIVTSGGTSPFPVTSFTFNTTGSTSTANISAAKVYYTGGSPDFEAVNQFGTTVSNPSGSFTVTGSQVLNPGTSHFWLAYDIAANATANHVVDAQCTGLIVDGIARVPTVTNPAGSRTIIELMNGVYTINPVGTGNRNFTSFGAAVAALSAVGISGAVTFEVASGTYTEQVQIPEIAGVSATNTITFDGGTGNASSRVLQFNTVNMNDYVLQLDGADYFRFKNLTIRSTGTMYGYVVHLTNAADYNHFMDCNIEAPATSTSAYAIGVLIGAPASYTSYGNWANHTLVENCNITGGYYGARLNGSSSTSTTISINNRFINNTITGWHYYGMYTYYQVAMQINGNYMENRTSSTGTNYGIYAYYSNEGSEVVGNHVIATYNPLRAMYHNRYRTSTSVRGLFANNMLVARGTGINYGLYVSYPQYTDVVYNSLNMLGTSTAYGIYNYGSSVAYDNKYLNNVIATASTGTFYAIYNVLSTSIDMSEFDYNSYYRSANGTTYFRWRGTNHTTLAAAQTAAPGYHQNSLWGANPWFISPTDLHSQSEHLYQAGVAFSRVTDDFDGDPRGNPPCIGADEFPEPPPLYDAAISDVRLGYADDKWARLEDPAAHTVDVVLESVGIEPAPSGITITYKVGSLPANQFDGVSQTFNPAWMNRKATVTFNQKVTGLMPTAALTVYARVFWAQDGDATNDIGSDTRRIDDVKVHGAENFNSMVAPYFSDDPGYLDYKWDVQNVNGGATWQVANGVGTGGSAALEYPGDVQQANDWIITPAAWLLGNASYRIKFNARSVTGAAQTLEVAYGQNPDPGSMTTFATFSNFTNTAFMTAKELAGGMEPYFNTQPLADGYYYVGIRVVSNAGAGALVVDDIVLDDNPSPPPIIAFGAPGEPLNTFIDTPSGKLLFQANYKSPGMITRTYEVQSSTNIYGLNGDFLWDVESSTPWISISKSTPEPTMQGYNFTPPRPRQFQDFTLTINPNGLAPGLHVGRITLYGILFNDDFPPPANGLIATNEPLEIDVELRVVNAGSKTGPSYEEAALSMPMLSGNTYDFVAPNTGNPIASVEVSSGMINGMTIRVYPNQLPLNLARMLYVKRYWQITHGGGTWTANITFPYTDQEAQMVADRNQLHGVRQSVPLGQWEDPIAGTASASDILNNSVRVFNLHPGNIGGNIALAQSYFIAARRGEAIPSVFGLEQNYPNPFNPSTTIAFDVAEERHVRLVVYNNLGMEVGVLANDVFQPGRYHVEFDARSLPSGSYLCRMMAGDVVHTIRMTLSK
jgi:hypothetical protein